MEKLAKQEKLADRLTEKLAAGSASPGNDDPKQQQLTDLKTRNKDLLDLRKIQQEQAVTELTERHKVELAELRARNAEKLELLAKDSATQHSELVATFSREKEALKKGFESEVAETNQKYVLLSQDDVAELARTLEAQLNL